MHDCLKASQQAVGVTAVNVGEGCWRDKGKLHLYPTQLRERERERTEEIDNK